MERVQRESCLLDGESSFLHLRHLPRSYSLTLRENGRVLPVQAGTDHLAGLFLNLQTTRDLLQLVFDVHSKILVRLPRKLVEFSSCFGKMDVSLLPEGTKGIPLNGTGWSYHPGHGQ